MISRMLRASMLDAHVYEEVESDSSAIVQAVLIVVVVAVARGVATLSVTDNILGIAFGIIAGLLSWVVWAFITYMVGTKLLKTGIQNRRGANWQGLQDSLSHQGYCLLLQLFRL